MKTMSLRIPDEVHDALRKEAYESRRPMNQIILEAIQTNHADVWDAGFEAGEQAGLMPSMHGDTRNPYRDGGE